MYQVGEVGGGVSTRTVQTLIVPNHPQKGIKRYTVVIIFLSKQFSVCRLNNTSNMKLIENMILFKFVLDKLSIWALFSWCHVEASNLDPVSLR